MNSLFYTFMVVFWYALLAGYMGAAMMAFVWAMFIRYCAQHLARDQARWQASPDNAKQPPDSVVLLDRAGVESSSVDLRP